MNTVLPLRRLSIALMLLALLSITAYTSAQTLRSSEDTVREDSPLQGSNDRSIAEAASIEPAHLVVGTVGEDIQNDSILNAGAVNLINGSANGLTAQANSLLTEDPTDPNALFGAGAGDRFGEVLARGDFNGDSIIDLAVGVPENDFAAAGAGIVHIFHGQINNSAYSLEQVYSWTQTRITGQALGANDRFGYALSAGDFNGDGYEDLAIGVPFDSAIEGGTVGGIVHVLYGSSAGLSHLNNQVWDQASPGIPGWNRIV